MENLTATQKQELAELKSELNQVMSMMPRTLAEQNLMNKRLFLLSQDIERLENPQEYKRNSNHWEGYQNRF